MLSALYEGMETKVLDESHSNADIRHALNRVAPSERIMLLGHGTDKGLFYRKDDTQDGFNGLVISHKHTYYLRKHSGNIIAVWCHADLFARAEGLHGLFTGMIISEKSEAAEYGIATTQEELDRENTKFAKRRRRLAPSPRSHVAAPRIFVAPPRRFAALARLPLSASPQ